MKDVANVLLIINHATDEELQTVKNTFQKITADTPLRLHLLYVKPNMPTCYFHMPSMAGMSNECNIGAKASLNHAGEILEVPSTHQWLATGNASAETRKLAKRLNTSFIIAGSIMHTKVSHHFGLGKLRKGCDIGTVTGLKEMCLQSHYA